MEKHIDAVLEIRKREDYHFERAQFCREHNMSLEALFHQQIEQELRQIARQMEQLFDTGYISITKD